MPLVFDTMRSGSAAGWYGRNCLTVGLVNNMPDAAWDATERQFIDLIGAAAPAIDVQLKLFSIPDVPRARNLRTELAPRYHAISDLWNMQLDGLIVTGTEPRAAKLEDEPYWPALTKLVDWARENTSSTIWSCLAAHAAVLHADGIERLALADKLSGVFECEIIGGHPLMSYAAQLRVPHSRHNDLPEAALTSCGYGLLSRSVAAGVDAFAKQQSGSSLFVFLQGHPEYDDRSLLREYRRDVARFLRGERAHYPATPQGYFSEQATRLVDAFRARAIDERQANLITDFPMSTIGAGLANTWSRSAIGLYQNWMGYLQSRKADRRASAQRPMRRSRRAAPSARASRPRSTASGFARHH